MLTPPPGIALAQSDGASTLAPPHPAEISAIRRRGVSQRRYEEFILGRRCAQTALGELGIRRQPVLFDDDRAPIWPATTVGSISHTDGKCIAIVGRQHSYRSLGVDVERRDRDVAGLAPWILSAAELARFSRTENRSPDELLLFFCIKESVIKCLLPLTRPFVDFAHLQVDIDFAKQRFVASVESGFVFSEDLPATIDGIITCTQDHVMALCTIAQQSGHNSFNPPLIHLSSTDLPRR